MKKILVAYYSWSNGNTKRIAEEIQKTVGADIVRIETVVPYPEDYNETVNQGQDEVNRNYRPEIKELGVDIDNYDVIIVGTPTWWYTMAPAVATFLEQNDFKGKTVVTFMTNGGWPGHVIKDMEKLSGGAKVLLPKEIKFDSQGGSHLETKQSEIDAWISEVKTLCQEG